MSEHDYLIIGAGPAGLQLGYLMQRAGVDYQILESTDGVGAFFRQFPRHRQLISINKVHTGETDRERNLRMDWNSLLSDEDELLFTRYSPRFFPPADDYLRYLEDFHTANDLNVLFGQSVERVADDDGGFAVHTAEDVTHRCRALVVATGVSREVVPEIPGIELAERYSETSIDPDDFIDERVLILGKGNSAFETADNLMETTAFIHVAGPSSIHLAWRTHFVGHLRAVNNNFLDTYQLKSQNAILDGDVVSIENDGDEFKVVFSFSRANEVHKELRYDRIITCTGFRFDDSIFDDSCRPAMAINDRFPAMDSGFQSENVPNLYFAGTIMQQRDYKKSTSAFIHGFRYSVRSLFHLLQHEHGKLDLPAQPVEGNAEALTEHLVTRLNKTSGLWQQFQFLADVVIPTDTGFDYIEELPVDYVHDHLANDHPEFLIVTLEYGPDHDKVDPFDIDVSRVAQDDSENALNAQYLHPVIRFHRQGELISEHHMAENLENEWDRPDAHVAPLQSYLASSIVAAPLDVAVGATR